MQSRNSVLCVALGDSLVCSQNPTCKALCNVSYHAVFYGDLIYSWSMEDHPLLAAYQLIYHIYLQPSETGMRNSRGGWMKDAAMHTLERKEYEEKSKAISVTGRGGP
jgi:hypothetical protein